MESWKDLVWKRPLEAPSPVPTSQYEQLQSQMAQALVQLSFDTAVWKLL